VTATETLAFTPLNVTYLTISNKHILVTQARANNRAKTWVEFSISCCSREEEWMQSLCQTQLAIFTCRGIQISAWLSI